MAKFITILLICCASVFTASTQPAGSGMLIITFGNRVGADSLELGKEYQNPHGEAFSVQNFKYYISNIRLTDTVTGRQATPPEQYYLVDERRPESKSIAMPLPAGQYHTISFAIGVDSIHNVSGTQTGALDPENGMFWTWNTGYIMAKLEGKSPLSKAPFGNITYHIGGYKAPENVLRQVLLGLPAHALVGDGNNARLSLHANINAWFAGRHAITIANHPYFMNPGDVAVQMADNYAHMFTVDGWYAEASQP